MTTRVSVSALNKTTPLQLTRQHDEAHELDRLASPRVDEQECGPVARNQTANTNDQVADRDVVQVLVHLGLLVPVRRASEADSSEHDGAIQTEPIKCNVECEPRVRSAEQNLAVPPLPKVVNEIGPGRLGGLDALDDRIGVDLVSTAGQERVDVLRGLLDVALDIHGVTRGLGDRETEVERDHSGDGAETDEQAPAVVDGIKGGGAVEDLALVGFGDDERDEGGSWRGRVRI